MRTVDVVETVAAEENLQYCSRNYNWLILVEVKMKKEGGDYI